MPEEAVAHILLRSNPDDPWKAALISGEAIRWNFRAIPHECHELLPHELMRVPIVNTARVKKLIEGLTCHPNQCGYAIALYDAGGATRDWAMHVVQDHVGDKIAAVIELHKRGASRQWVKDTLADVPIMDMGIPYYEMVRLGLLNVAEAERMIENMPKGSGQAALGMHVNGMSKLSWTIRVILADRDDRARTAEILKRLSLKDGKQ